MYSVFIFRVNIVAIISNTVSLFLCVQRSRNATEGQRVTVVPCLVCCLGRDGGRAGAGGPHVLRHHLPDLHHLNLGRRLSVCAPSCVRACVLMCVRLFVYPFVRMSVLVPVSVLVRFSMHPCACIRVLSTGNPSVIQVCLHV